MVGIELFDTRSKPPDGPETRNQENTMTNNMHLGKGTCGTRVFRRALGSNPVTKLWVNLIKDPMYIQAAMGEYVPFFGQ